MSSLFSGVGSNEAGNAGLRRALPDGTAERPVQLAGWHQQVTCIRAIFFSCDWLKDRMASGVGCNKTLHPLPSK